mmetsp:Transcript_13003/g.33882  ORF Transcript_13003/g.33882 Transcript_13003/m.33882 type:complete len:232 (-) Transcript_13003:46-741(-)
MCTCQRITTQGAFGDSHTSNTRPRRTLKPRSPTAMAYAFAVVRLACSGLPARAKQAARWLHAMVTAHGVLMLDVGTAGMTIAMGTIGVSTDGIVMNTSVTTTGEGIHAATTTVRTTIETTTGTAATTAATIMTAATTTTVAAPSTGTTIGAPIMTAATTSTETIGTIAGATRTTAIGTVESGTIRATRSCRPQRPEVCAMQMLLKMNAGMASMIAMPVAQTPSRHAGLIGI